MIKLELDQKERDKSTQKNKDTNKILYKVKKLINKAVQTGRIIDINIKKK